MRNLFENLALIAMTDMLLSSMVENESRTACRPTFIREDSCNCGCAHKPTSRFFAEHLTPREDKKWGVCECNPREDRNKRFGIRATVDEPRREEWCPAYEHVVLWPHGFPPCAYAHYVFRSRQAPRMRCALSPLRPPQADWHR